MRHFNTCLRLALVPWLLFAVVACGGRGAPVETTPTVPAVEKPAVPAPTPEPARTEVVEDFPPEKPTVEDVAVPPTIEEVNRSGVLRTVYFAYDSYELTPLSIATLRENAEFLKAHPEYRLVVEGHCDERGTIEYNLALGQRRAGAVRDYLTSLGLNRSRIRNVTYGEERPVDPGHDERAWSKNRRAEFVVER